MTAAMHVGSLRDEAATLERLLERLLALTGAHRAPDHLRDAVFGAIDAPVSEPVVEEGSDMPAPPRWMDTVLRAAERVGLRASRVRLSPDELLGIVGPKQPIVTSAILDGRETVVIASERRGSSVLVEVPGASEGRWVASSAVVLSVADGKSDALTVDHAFPLSGHSENPHEHPTPEERLLKLVLAERHDLGAILAYALFLGFFTLTLPAAVQALVNTVAFGTLLQPLVVLTVLLFGALVFSAALRGLQTFVTEIVQRRIFVRVVAELAYRLPRVERATFDRADGPELVNRFFDTFTVQKAAATLLLDGLEITLTVTVGMLALAFYHPLLLAFDVVLVVALIVIIVAMGRRGPKTAIAESARKYEVGAWLEEIVRHDALIKLGGGLRHAELRAEALARDYLRDRRTHFGVVFRQTIAVLSLQAFANACVLGIGGWLVIGRQLTLGQLVAAELIVTTVVASLAKVGKYLENYYDLLAALDKLGHLTDLPLEREGGLSCEMVGASGGASVAFDGVRGGYEGGDDVLRAVSFTLAPGSRTAISGPTGSGKSLLVEFMAALRTPKGGRILVDGLDLRDLDLADFRERIAIVRPEVISGSVLENVRLGRVELDVRAVRRALELVGLLDDIDGLPDGIRTELTPTGEPLSASQKLRLAVARAVASDPSLLVIDDAIDGLDPRVREPMLDALFAADRAWTLLVVSNDPRVLARCDTVLALSDGIVDELPRRSR